MKRPYWILILIVAGCISPPQYSDVPEISAPQVDKTIAIPGQDSLEVSFEFRDGNGDLGSKSRDTVINAFLIDTRTGFKYSYQLPYISEQAEDQSVTGTIWITVEPFTFSCRPNRPNFDTLAYEIYIIDRAGNESNRITTPNIVLDCP